MMHRSKSPVRDARNRGKNRKTEAQPNGKGASAVVGRRKPLARLLGRKEDTDKSGSRSIFRSSFSPRHMTSTGSLPGLVRDKDGDWDSSSDSSYTNLSETEAAWLLAFDDIISQVGSKISGIDELLDVLSVDGEEQQVPPRFAITVETQNYQHPSKAKKLNSSDRSVQSAPGSEPNVPTGLCACVDNFACGDNFAFWETIRASLGVNCVDPGDFMNMMRERSQERQRFLSELDTNMDGSPLVRTNSGKKVQFEMDTRPIPFWARRSWKRRSGLQVIPKTNNDRAAAGLQSCLRNPPSQEMDTSNHSIANSLSEQPKVSIPKPLEKKVARDKTAKSSPKQDKTAKSSPTRRRSKSVENDAESRNSIIDVEEKEATIEVHVEANATVPSRKTPKLKSFFKPASMALKFLQKKPVIQHRVEDHAEELPPLGDGETNTITLVPEPADDNGGTPICSFNEADDSTESDTSIKKGTSKRSEASNNSTLLEDWSSSSSKLTEETEDTELKCRLLDRFSTSPPRYSSPKSTLEGLTIECQKSFEDDETSVDVASLKNHSKNLTVSNSPRPPRQSVDPQSRTVGVKQREIKDEDNVFMSPETDANSSWYNFDNLDENGFPANSFKVSVEEKVTGWTHVGAS